MAALKNVLPETVRFRGGRCVCLRAAGAPGQLSPGNGQASASEREQEIKHRAGAGLRSKTEKLVRVQRVGCAHLGLINKERAQRT